MSNLKALPLPELKSIAALAFQSMSQARPSRGRGGCGRVYIEFSDGIRDNSKIKSTLQEQGFKVTRRPYHKGVRIYVGYDNATGHEFNMADNAAAVFKEHGISCYVDGDGD